MGSDFKLFVFTNTSRIIASNSKHDISAVLESELHPLCLHTRTGCDNEAYVSGRFHTVDVSSNVCYTVAEQAEVYSSLDLHLKQGRGYIVAPGSLLRWNGKLQPRLWITSLL